MERMDHLKTHQDLDQRRHERNGLAYLSQETKHLRREAWWWHHAMGQGSRSEVMEDEWR